MSANANVVQRSVETEIGLIRAHGLAALAMVVYSALLGFTIGLKFHWPDFLGDTSWLTWGRLRYAHTQGIFFGWLGNAFLAFFYHALPRLTGRPVTSRALGWLLFFVWNFLVVVPGWVLVQMGVSQPLEWAEFPLSVDAFVVLAFALMAIQFVLPFFRQGVSELYVSGWYIMGGIVFTLFAYPVGNFVPELVPGAQGATYSGLWIHDAVGLYATPFAVAILYFVIPTVTGRPIYSHFLSMLTFWMLFFIYPLNGTHHYLFSSIPMEAQIGAIVASVYLGMDVILNVSNLLLSLKGSAAVVARDVPLRFVWASIVCYVAVSVQGSMQSLMPVNRFVHFTDWVIGHAHFAMIGFASFAAIAGLLHVWRQSPGLRYSARAANWTFWLMGVGLFLMVSDLTMAGMVQGQLWQSDTMWIESVSASQPYWISRSLTALPLLAGFVALCLSMLTGPVVQEIAAPVALRWYEGAEPLASEQVALETAGHNHRGLPWLKSAYVLTGVAGFGSFLFSFIVLAVWPNQTLEGKVAAERPSGLPALTAGELRGRAVYGRDGCVNCHSQIVRATVDDVRRFGLASQAWETDQEFPQLWGTRRIGPDLARESGKRTHDWHLTHLWNPRWVVPDSNMPPYPWLFNGSALQPTQDALDLVAYLDSLGRDARLAGTLLASSGKMDAVEEKRMGIFCDCAIPRTPGPAPLLSTDLAPAELARFGLRGAALFARHCNGCHGADGKGDGVAALSLLPAPRDLTTAHFSDRALSRALWDGVRGSSMPGWYEMSANDLRSLAARIRSLEGEPARAKKEAPLSADDGAKVENLYLQNCARCHGAKGKGDGAAAGALYPRPTEFAQIRPSLAYAEEVLLRGVPGTAMPPWRDRFDAAQRRTMATYVRSLYQPSSPSL